MKLNNNLTASDYLIFNPYFIGEEVLITLKSNKIYNGMIESVYYNIDNRTIISIVNVDDICHHNLYEYIVVTYDLISKDYFFKIEDNMYYQGLFKSEDILSILPNSCDNEEYNIRNAFQNLFECNYICKFKDTDICDKCFNFKEFKYIDDKKILLLGDRVKMKDTNYKATIIGISHYNEFMNTNNDICYSYLIDDRDVNLDKKIIDNHSLLPFRFRKDNTLNLYYRVGYVKNIIDDYYCDKCIFQSCNKCLIKKL